MDINLLSQNKINLFPENYNLGLEFFLEKW